MWQCCNGQQLRLVDIESMYLKPKTRQKNGNYFLLCAKIKISAVTDNKIIISTFVRPPFAQWVSRTHNLAT